MSYLVGALGFAYFLAITLATKLHFRSQKFPPGMLLISIMSIFGTGLLVFASSKEAITRPYEAVTMISLAFAVFLWSVCASRNANLAVAFDTKKQSQMVIQQGPWKFIRHPFYVSYSLFWLACMVAHPSYYQLGTGTVLIFIYVTAALREERDLLGSQNGAQYQNYMKTAGFFWPKFSRVGE